MKDSLARLWVRGEDLGDSLVDRMTVARMWGRVAAPAPLWVLTLVGASAALLVAFTAGDPVNLWLTLAAVWGLLTLCTGPIESRTGGLPLPGAGVRGWVWLVTSLVVTVRVLVAVGGHVAGSLEILGVVAVVLGGTGWLLERRRRQRAEDVALGLAEPEYEPPMKANRRVTRIVVGVTVIALMSGTTSGSDLLRWAAIAIGGYLVWTGWRQKKEAPRSRRGIFLGLVGVIVVSDLLVKHMGTFGQALAAAIWIGIPLAAGSALGGASGLGFWPVLILIMAGVILGGQVAAWYPPGTGETRAKRAGGQSWQERLAAARAGAPVIRDAEAISPAAAAAEAETISDNPAAYLMQERIPTGILAGATMVDGRPQYRRGIAPHMALFAQSGAGKTRRVIAPNVLSHDGPVVTTSTKDDLALLTTAVRRRGGRVWFWDPAGTLPVPAGTEVARWSPMCLIFDKDSAISTANRLIAAGSIASKGSDSGKFFTDQAGELLAPLMYAAVLAKGGQPEGAMSLLMQWLVAGPSVEGEGGWDTAVAALADAGETGLALQVKNTRQEAQGAAERRVSDTIATIRQILAVYRRDRVTLEADQPNIDLREFAASDGDTIHIAMTADEHDVLAPLVALFVDSIVSARRQVPEQQRNEAPLLLALDELASVPLPRLQSYLSEARGWGVRVVAGLQTQAQLEAWPNGKALKSQFPWTVIFRNCGDIELMREVSEFQGDTIVHRESVSTAQTTMGRSLMQGAMGHHGGPKDPTHSVSEQTERLLKINEVAGILGDGEIRLIEGRIDRGVYYAPDVDERPWAALRQACEDAMLVELHEPEPVEALVPEPRVSDDQVEVQPLD